MTVDLENLKKLLAEGTPGEITENHIDDGSGYVSIEDQELLVALHNSAPDLVREMEAARAVVEAARNHYTAFQSTPLGDALVAYDTATAKEPSR